MKQKSISKNIVMSMILTVSNFIFPLITYAYVARTLLPAGTGRVAFVSSVVSYFAIIGGLGVSSYGVRQCAKIRDNKDALSQTVQEIFVVNLIATIVAYLLLFTAVFSIAKFRLDYPLYLIMSCSIFLTTLGMEWLYKAVEEYTYITIRSLVFRTIGVILTFILIKDQSDYKEYAVLLVFNSSGSYVLNFINARKHVEFSIKRKLHLKQHLRPIFTLFFASLTTSVYAHFDTLMLGFIKDDVEVGLYNCALKIKNIVVGVSSGLTTTLIPRIVYYYNNSEINRFNNLIKRSMQISCAVTVTLATYIMVNSREIILFLSGDKYLEAAPILVIFMLCAYVLILTNFFGYQLLIPLGREKVYAYSVTIAMLANVFLNLLLIPAFGASGAAFATLVAESINVIIMSNGVKKERAYVFRNVNYLPYLLGNALGILLIVATRPLISNLHVFIRLTVSSVLYFAVCWGTMLIMKEPTMNAILIKIKTIAQKLFLRNDSGKAC